MSLLCDTTHLVIIFFICQCIFVMCYSESISERIRSHFNKDDGSDVMKAIRNTFSQNCLDVLVEQKGNLPQFNKPYVIFRLDNSNSSSWDTLISSPFFSFSCMVIFMLDIPIMDDYEKLLLLRRRGIILYHIIISSNKADSLDHLMNPRLKNEENVALVNRQDSGSWEIQTRQIFSEMGYLNLVISNIWSPFGGFQRGQEIFPDQMKNFYGYTMRGTTLDFMPFTDYEVLPTSPVVRGKPSLDFYMLDTIADHLNFTYEIRRPEDGLWGIRTPDGDWKGVVGDVYKGISNFSLVLSLTVERRKDVDFSVIYFFDPLTFVTSKVRQDDQWTKLVTPFKGTVWGLLLVTCIIYCILYLPHVMMSLTKSVTQIFQPLVNQSIHSLSQNVGGQVFIGMWLLFTLVLTSYYKTSLMAKLTVPAVPATIETLQQLLDSKLQWGSIDAKGSEYAFLATSKSLKHQNIFKQMMFFSSAESMENVNKGGYAYIYFKSNLQDIIDKQFTDASGYSKMDIAREEIFSSTYAWAFPKGASHRRTFNEVITRCIETGLQIHWLKETKRLSQEKTSKKSDTAKEDSGQVVLSLDHLKGLFAVLILGYALSLVVFVCEFFMGNYFRKQQNRSYFNGQILKGK